MYYFFQSNSFFFFYVLRLISIGGDRRETRRGVLNNSDKYLVEVYRKPPDSTILFQFFIKSYKKIQ